jgi:hypothetical protein
MGESGVFFRVIFGRKKNTALPFIEQLPFFNQYHRQNSETPSAANPNETAKMIMF